jgi:hypothetical protein
VDVLERRLFCCFCQVLNIRSFSVNPSHFTDCNHMVIEDNTKVHINKMRFGVWFACV